MRSVNELLDDVRGKRVVIRCDFNVPLNGDVITDDGRIRAALPTLTGLLEAGAKVVLNGRDAGKLEAAARLGVLVVALRRPEQPRGVPVVESGEAAAAWVLGH